MYVFINFFQNYLIFNIKIFLLIIMLNLKKSIGILLVTFSVIFIISYIYTKQQTKEDQSKEIMKNYMGFIFIILGLMKLYDINKFANIFSKYDIISKDIIHGIIFVVYYSAILFIVHYSLYTAHTILFIVHYS